MRDGRGQVTERYQRDIGRAGVSETLRRFTQEFPGERGPLLAFAQEVAADVAPGGRLLDIGAGDAPYRELFAHLEYVTNDWSESVHTDAASADVIASADSIPLPDGHFDAVLCTQVLEHVPEPAKVLAEAFRLLRAGGTLYLSAPLAWEQHEMPYDFYRYTSEGLRFLAMGAGFEEVDVRARNDSFTTLAQLMRNLSYALGRAEDGLDGQREQARVSLNGLADSVELLAPLDAEWSLPLGFTLRAGKPHSSP